MEKASQYGVASLVSVAAILRQGFALLERVREHADHGVVGISGADEMCSIRHGVWLPRVLVISPSGERGIAFAKEH
jgi:hypothetical protein